MDNQKCHFRIYIRDEENNFTIPFFKDGKVMVFHSLQDATLYAQKVLGLKGDYKIK